jgi:hypothetical protein
MQLFKSRLLILAAALVLSLQLAGCSKDKVKITSAAVVNLDKGSGNFDRVMKICFNEPLKSEYYHKVKIVTYEDVKIEGEGWLRPLASDPDNKCQLRNIYLYINKNSPPHARDLIHDYVKPGNIKALLVQIYFDKPEGKEIPVDEKLFKDL